MPLLARALLVGLLFGSASAPANPPAAITSPVRTRPCSPFRLRFLKLAGDPAHGGDITKGSFREAYVGLRLERSGILPGAITRDPSGSAEFQDGAGTRWDVKGFSSHWPVAEGGFLLANAESSLAEELAAGQNVILDRKSLSSAHDEALARLVVARGWQARVLWYPARPQP